MSKLIKCNFKAKSFNENFVELSAGHDNDAKTKTRLLFRSPAIYGSKENARGFLEKYVCRRLWKI